MMKATVRTRMKGARAILAIAGALLAGLAATPSAQAQSVKITFDASFAEHLLGTVCSRAPVDEDYYRASSALQGLIRITSNARPERTMDAFMAGLEAAAKCETPQKDYFHFSAVVNDKAGFAETVAFFKSHADEIAAFVADSLIPYTPADLDYSGSLLLAIVGNPCGGFADGRNFFLALSCLRGNYENELHAAKSVSAHETYHAVQHEFFYSSTLRFENAATKDDAFDMFFSLLLEEGTAEYAVDSRRIEGSGTLTDYIKGFAANGYAQLPFHMRLFDYAAGAINAARGRDDLIRRLKDVVQLGFSGDNRQIFYYVGAAMAARIDAAHGRTAYLCVLRLPPEQFIRAYRAAAGGDAPPLGPAVLKAAERLSRTRAKRLRYETCIG
ncbi:MAG: DUF5700 domain-containing putative Zn-dependent protease [Alphaproteobacteria bacterium]